MAALRSLESEAVWWREFNRRLRDNHVCNLCGASRDTCICQEISDDPVAGTEPEGAPE